MTAAIFHLHLFISTFLECTACIVTMPGSGWQETEVFFDFQEARLLAVHLLPPQNRRGWLQDPSIPSMLSVLCPLREGLLLSVMKRHLASHPLPCLDSICIISSFSSEALCWRGLVDLLIQLLMYNSSYSQLQKSLNGITENVFSLISSDSSREGAEISIPHKGMSLTAGLRAWICPSVRYQGDCTDKYHLSINFSDHLYQ